MKPHNYQDIKGIKLAILLVMIALLFFSYMAPKEENRHGKEGKTCEAQAHLGVCQS